MSDFTFDMSVKLKPYQPKLKKFVRLTRKKRKLKEQLKEIEASIRELVGDGDELGELLKAFVENKIQNVPGVDGMTVYLTRKVYASSAVKKSDDEEAYIENQKKIIEVLKTLGLDEFTSNTFSGAALGAYFKEQQEVKEQDLDEIIEIEEVIPTLLKDIIKVSEKFTLAGKGK
jgi:hypothetical protein